MGVPAFFRWLQAKYPKIMTKIVEEKMKDTVITNPNPNGMEFDNLYIDMNGIIHPCVHPEEGPAPETEQQMFEAIGRYVDRLMYAIRPRRLLYLAIDGVAPRAKMNQQRSRRFKAAREMEDIEEVEREKRAELAARGIHLPPKKKGFDYNVITPGTAFMDRLGKYLRDYVARRVASTPGWKDINVILSDANVPGEGEHKIMAYVRLQRSQPGYDPNTSHVLHGLDADLIMLGLATHEVNFNILREEVLFGKQQAKKCHRCGQSGHMVHQCTGQPRQKQGAHGEMDGATSVTKPLELLRLPVLREYLEAEFSVLKTTIPEENFDLERIIDDFIFMCFFVGNDFLPHLPSLDIREGAVDLLFQLYKNLLPSLGDYITNSGSVDLDRVDVLLGQIGQIEDQIFQRRREQELRDARRFKQQKQRATAGAGGPSGAGGGAGAGAGAGAGGGAGGSDAKRSNPSSKKKRGRDEDSASTAASPKAPKAEPGSSSTDPAASGSVPEPSSKRRATSDGSVAADAESGAADATPAADQEGTEGAGGATPGADGASESPSANTTADGEATPIDADVVSDAESEVDIVEEAVAAAVDGGLDAADEAEAEALAEAQAELKMMVRIAAYDNSVNDDVVDKVMFGTAGWKTRYYETKFGADDARNETFRRRINDEYIKGLVWVFKYYYVGVPSWNWFYPFHYAPFASDLVNRSKEPIVFDQGKPFSPIGQLMSVFPERSAHALPKACQELMNERSIIGDFYPSKFECDPNGKRFAWQWVVLLPFIDEKRLLDALQSVESTFNEEEKWRNRRGQDMLFVSANHKCSEVVEHLAALSADGSPYCLKPTATWYTLGAATYLNEGRPRPEAVDPSRYVVVEYIDPAKRPHKCQILEGAEMPDAVLSPQDKVLRTPRLSRGMTIVDLANTLPGVRPTPVQQPAPGLGLHALGRASGGTGVAGYAGVRGMGSVPFSDPAAPPSYVPSYNYGGRPPAAHAPHSSQPYSHSRYGPSVGPSAGGYPPRPAYPAPGYGQGPRGPDPRSYGSGSYAPSSYAPSSYAPPQYGGALGAPPSYGGRPPAPGGMYGAPGGMGGAGGPPPFRGPPPATGGHHPSGSAPRPYTFSRHQPGPRHGGSTAGSARDSYHYRR